MTAVAARPLARPSALATGRGKLILALLCSIAFLDFVDASITNVALPLIRDDLHLSVQGLQWVPSGYLLTYGGFMLLGGRLADLLGRRRVVVVGTALIGISSLAGGLAQNEGTLVAARLAQGLGAALMLPAALSILTTTFTEPADRHKALGVWGGVGGLASAAGVLLGGLLTDGPGWRWVFFVNPPAAALVLVAVFRLIAPDGPRRQTRGFDLIGAVLATAGMLLLVFTLVKAPDEGWGSTATVLRLVGAGVLLAAFVAKEAIGRIRCCRWTIFRVRGLAAADVTQLIAFAGFLAIFFFLTLYMQNVLGYSPIKTGAAYLPLCGAIGVSAGITGQLISPHRHSSADRRRRTDHVGRGLRAVADPRPRLVRERSAARSAHRRVRHRCRVRRDGDRGERRRAAGQGGSGGGAAQRLAATRRRARAGDLLGDRDRADEPAARPARRRAARADRRIPPRLARGQRLPARGGRGRRPLAEHARREQLPAEPDDRISRRSTAMIDNLPARRTIGGEVDFTMMYAAHDAFSRHLDRIAEALERDGAVSRPRRERWTLFAKQLHIHHTAEDEALWPMLRAAIASPDELAVLDAMEAEHAQLDPQLERIDALDRRGARVRRGGQRPRARSACSRGHMRHEENAALPLIDAYLGRAGWAEFGRHIRSTQGISGAAVYLPWLLDGAPADLAKRILAVLPPPVRVLYRVAWRRRYRARFG